MKENQGKKTSEQTYFSKVWVEDEDFKKWLSPTVENTQTLYNQCNKIFNLSNVGRQALVNDAAGKKYITLSNRSQTFFHHRAIISSTKEPDS